MHPIAAMINSGVDFSEEFNGRKAGELREACLLFRQALAVNNRTVINALIQGGINIKCCGMLCTDLPYPAHLPPLMHAFEKSHIDIVTHLLHEGADAKVVDSLGRSILHLRWPAASKDSASAINEYKRVCMEAEEQIMRKDAHGLTPLHMAVLEEDSHRVELLLEMGADPTAKDKNDLSPFEMSRGNIEVFGMLESKTGGSSTDLKATKQPSCQSEGQNDTLFIDPEHDISSKHHLYNWLQCEHKKMQHNVNSDVHKLMTQMLCTMSESELADMRGAKEELFSLLNQVSNRMAGLNEDFRFRPILSGSVGEGTKVIENDEFDVLCLLVNKRISAFRKAEISPSFIHIEVTNTLTGSREALVCRDLFNNFYQDFFKVLRDPTLWKNCQRLYWLDINEVTEYRSISKVCLAYLTSEGKLQRFSVDIVPTLDTEGRIPAWSKTDHELLKANGCYVVAKWAPDVSVFGVNVFQISFNVCEREMFFCMLPALKQAYMLLKIILHFCPTIEYVAASHFFSSYILKTCIFWIFSKSETYQNTIANYTIQERLPHEPMGMEDPYEVRQWALKALDHLEECLKQKHLSAFFLPGYNLLEDQMYLFDWRPQLYIDICRALLSEPSAKVWQKLLSGMDFEYWKNIIFDYKLWREKLAKRLEPVSITDLSE